MSRNEIDVRNSAGVPSTLRFADNNGGAAKIRTLEQGVPSQIKATTSGGYVVIESKDIPSLVDALLLAEKLWGLQTNRGRKL